MRFGLVCENGFGTDCYMMLYCNTVNWFKFLVTNFYGLRQNCTFVNPLVNAFKYGSKYSLNSKFRGLMLSTKSTKIGIHVPPIMSICVIHVQGLGLVNGV